MTSLCCWPRARFARSDSRVWLGGHRPFVRRLAMKRRISRLYVVPDDIIMLCHYFGTVLTQFTNTYHCYFFH